MTAEDGRIISMNQQTILDAVDLAREEQAGSHDELMKGLHYITSRLHRIEEMLKSLAESHQEEKP